MQQLRPPPPIVWKKKKKTKEIDQLCVFYPILYQNAYQNNRSELQIARESIKKGKSFQGMQKGHTVFKLAALEGLDPGCKGLWALHSQCACMHIIRMVTFGGGNITECSYRWVWNDIEGRL